MTTREHVMKILRFIENETADLSDTDFIEVAEILCEELDDKVQTKQEEAEIQDAARKGV